MKIKLDKIIIDAGTQTRVTLNEETIADYAEAMTEGAKFPDVVVFADGTDYLLADGFHRFMAAQRCGWREIDVELHKGSRLDAIKYSLGANTGHGLRRSNADKRRCVEIALKEFAGMSDRAVAEMCGVSHEFVRQERAAQLSTVDSSAPRKGLDGKTRAMPRAARDVFNDAEKEEKEVDGKNKPIMTKRQMAECRPCVGMQFARMAIMDLEKIEANDLERSQAFLTIKGWITEHEN